MDQREQPVSPWARRPAPVQRRAHGRFYRRFFLIAALFALGLFGLMTLVPPRQWNGLEQIILVRYALIGLFIVALFAGSAKSLPRLAGELAFWAVAILALVGVYGYRFELHAIADRVLYELVPGRGQAVAGHGEISFARGADGQFWIDARVEGVPIRFLLDTGASSVTLTRADAERLGFRWSALRFTQSFDTANGTVRGAPVELRELAIGPIRFDRVPADVNEGEMSHSLLGMRLLERLGSIEIRHDTLTIRE